MPPKLYSQKFHFQLYEKLLEFSRPERDDDDEENTSPDLPPAFHPLLKRMEEQENRYYI